MLGALACMLWGPSFTGYALKRQESAVVRRAGSSKWVNPIDPEMSHPSGLYVLPIKPAKKQENYVYTWKNDKNGVIQDFMRVPYDKNERAGDFYAKRTANGCWDHWGPSGEGEAA